MRLDKYLKISRLIKRRSLAKDVAGQGRIMINGQKAKASAEISIGDELVIQFGQKLVTVEVTGLHEQVKKGESDMLYKVVKEEQLNQS